MKSKEILLAITEFVFLSGALLLLIGSFSTTVPAVAIAPVIICMVVFAIYFRVWRVYVRTCQPVEGELLSTLATTEYGHADAPSR